VISILEQFGFVLIATKGSHYRLRRMVGIVEQSISIPVHGNRSLNLKTLRSIYRQARQYVPEEELRKHFYTD
jgi:predicted RNA binding protein YcfA (HicA-like mRNA interferase family)